MTVTDWLSVAIVVAGSAAFYGRRGLRYLRYFQQEEYAAARFAYWWWHVRACDRRGTAVSIAMAAFGLAGPGGGLSLVVHAAGAAALAVTALREEDPRTSGKITLKMTERARRIYGVGWVLHLVWAIAVVGAVVALAGAYRSSLLWLSQIAVIQAIPFTIMAANAVLQPIEQAGQRRFLSEARAVLGRVNPYVIGITGSYGKTSTKAILGRMLEVMAPTFCPPRSINTLMGITREIRERLTPSHRYAVIEMGAYQEGSIRRLCELTPPKAGIVTCVGLMHLERYGSTERVFRAKSELAQAIPADGILVCNGDDEGARRIAEQNRKRVTLLYGLRPERVPLDCFASGMQQSPDGTRLTLHWQGKEYPAATPLLGTPMLSNILAAFTMASALGAEVETLLAVIRTLDPVENRLQPVWQRDVLYLRDAYNSNPVGFTSALDVLAAMPGKRKILVTPGMVELGSRQEEENRQVAAYAAHACDMAIIVGDTNREPLVQGFRTGGLADAQTLTFPDRDSALAHVAAMQTAGDVVLIENDLPDLYEAQPRF